MALQRPVPPPRRSLLAKSTINTDGENVQTPRRFGSVKEAVNVEEKAGECSLRGDADGTRRSVSIRDKRSVDFPVVENNHKSASSSVVGSTEDIQKRSTASFADSSPDGQKTPTSGISIDSLSLRSISKETGLPEDVDGSDELASSRSEILSRSCVGSTANDTGKSRASCNLSIENPTYDSRTIPFRSKPAPELNSGCRERTSNLIWFRSGVPPEFTVKTESSSPEKTDNSTKASLSLVFAPLDEPCRLPSPIAPPPVFLPVQSLYPKLPPSPVIAECVNWNVDDSTVRTDHCRPESRREVGISMSSDRDTFVTARSRQSSAGQPSPTPASGSLLEPGSLSDADDNSGPIVGTCTLMLNQPSLDGSMSSSTSDRAAGVSSREGWVPPNPPVFVPPVADANERLKLTPAGTNIGNAGWLNRVGLKKKETIRRWCVLKNGVFEIYQDDASDAPMESVLCKSMEMVSVRVPNEPSGTADNAEPANAFTVSFLTDARKLDAWTFSAFRMDDLIVWMTLLTKCIVQSEAADMCEAVDRTGALYLKKGTTAEWESGWFVMRGNVLLYAAKGDVCCYEIDMRKVIRIRSVSESNDCCPFVQCQVPFAFVVTTEGSALYAQSRDSTTTRAWRDAIEASLTARKGSISEHRLSTDDIPIIVEKCISFVAVYGLNVEGIYRHCGTMTKVKVLLEQFMKDPHGVHLRADEYTVHDVTSVLRKYFRELHDPLITSTLRPRFIERSGLQEHGSRLMIFKGLLNELPVVNYNTLRKLLRHLKTVAQHASKNMMTVQNLAAIFGPTLFTVDRELVGEGNSSYVSAAQAINIIAEMIIDYDELFNVDSAELQREQRIEEALQRIECHNIIKTPSQLLLSIHVLEKDANVFNMQITNKVTSAEVCSFAVVHKKLPYAATQLALFEVVCNGRLERIMGPDEKLLDILSRWSSWPLEERATTYVIVKLDHFKERMESMSASSLLTSCDVQYSESKSFRKCTFHCCKGEVLMYKNAKATKPIQSWPLDKLFWYFGCETRRPAPTGHALTFIDKDVIVRRNKSAPFFGRCVCFQDDSDLLKWLATVTLSNRPLRTDF